MFVTPHNSTYAYMYLQNKTFFSDFSLHSILREACYSHASSYDIDYRHFNKSIVFRYDETQ